MCLMTVLNRASSTIASNAFRTVICDVIQEGVNPRIGVILALIIYSRINEWMEWDLLMDHIKGITQRSVLWNIVYDEDLAVDLATVAATEAV